MHEVTTNYGLMQNQMMLFHSSVGLAWVNKCPQNALYNRGVCVHCDLGVLAA